jgi:hypothetical protein
MALKATHPYQRGEPVEAQLGSQSSLLRLLAPSTTSFFRAQRNFVGSVANKDTPPPSYPFRRRTGRFAPFFRILSGRSKSFLVVACVRNIRVRFSLCVFKPTACSLAPTSNAHAPRSSGGVAGPVS